MDLTDRRTHLEDSVLHVQDVDVVVSSTDYKTVILKKTESIAQRQVHVGSQCTAVKDLILTSVTQLIKYSLCVGAAIQTWNLIHYGADTGRLRGSGSV